MEALVTLQLGKQLFKQGYILFHQHGKNHQDNMRFSLAVGTN